MQDKQDCYRPGLRKLFLAFLQIPPTADAATIDLQLASYKEDSLYQQLCTCRDILNTEVEFESYLDKSIYNSTIAMYFHLDAEREGRVLTHSEDLLFTGIEDLLGLESARNQYK